MGLEQVVEQLLGPVVGGALEHVVLLAGVEHQVMGRGFVHAVLGLLAHDLAARAVDERAQVLAGPAAAQTLPAEDRIDPCPRRDPGPARPGRLAAQAGQGGQQVFVGRGLVHDTGVDL